ncbi:MAG: hypothetical protein CMO43_02860 [Verrucomicrobiales bacterium]|nr:hypothetical protein [Verrucomicrobiales bacterium]MBL44152.1 hypothetical protein [Sphingomonadaceae bacterium]
MMAMAVGADAMLLIRAVRQVLTSLATCSFDTCKFANFRPAYRRVHAYAEHQAEENQHGEKRLQGKKGRTEGHDNLAPLAGPITWHKSIFSSNAEAVAQLNA